MIDDILLPLGHKQIGEAGANLAPIVMPFC